MTSFRQVEANRSNALGSTGPKTEDGKRRSRRNAVRHGLTAETIIVALEDIEDYEAFEAAITLDYDARTAVERELVLRLASLLWRLRRATAVETELLQIQAETLKDRHGLQRLPKIRLEKLPRMADFALWATACETAFWPPGTFLRAYDANRRAAIDGIVEADPVATFVREIMAERSTWVGKASDLLQARLDEKNPPSTAGLPTNPRALAARLRRCQTFLRSAGIDIAFSREGRVGSRMIRMTSLAKTRAATAATTTGNGWDALWRNGPQPVTALGAATMPVGQAPKIGHCTAIEWSAP